MNEYMGVISSCNDTNDTIFDDEKLLTKVKMNQNEDEYIMGIESSCDDTCVAIMKNDIVLANIRMSQQEMCDYYGGVVPDIAARNHFYNLHTCIEKALRMAQITIHNISIIASTIGPGLIGSLLIGSSFAKYLSILTNKVFVPVHHLEAHLDVLQQQPPYLAVIISGGHSQIFHCRDLTDYVEICSTRDDAFGELIDKVGRKLGLPVPSGPAMEECASHYNGSFEHVITVLPRDLSFSCSGLKTHFLNLIETNQYTKEYICALLQHTIAHNLNVKIRMAMSTTQCDKVIVAGGVAANQYIRNYLNYCKFAPIALCTDNAVMVCMSAMKHIKNKSPHINNTLIPEFASMRIDEWLNMIH